MFWTWWCLQHLMPELDLMQFEATIIKGYSHHTCVKSLWQCSEAGTLKDSELTFGAQIAPCGQSRIGPKRSRHESATAGSYFAGQKVSMNAQVQASAQRLCSPCVIVYRPGFKPFSSASLPVRKARSCAARPRQLVGATWSRPASPQPGRTTHLIRAAAVGTDRSSATFVVSTRVSLDSK